MHGFDRQALSAQHALDIHQATGVAADNQFRPAILNVPNLIFQHGCGDVRILDRKGPAETAAVVRVDHFYELGPPDVYVISVDTIGRETIPHMGMDRLLSEDPYFKGNYKPWQIFPGGDYYGYAIMFHVDWAVRQGFPVVSVPAKDWQNK